MIDDNREIFYMTNDLQNSFSSHNLLCKLACELRDTSASKVTIDLTDVSFIASNLFSVLGCIFSDFALRHPGPNPIYLKGLKESTRKIIQKNGFGEEHLGIKKIADSYNTVIPYKIFSINDINDYERYLTLNLFTRKDLPQMSQAVSDCIRDYLLELFKNVMDHTTSKFIFTCGQYFPNSSMLYFTIVDTGETIPYNVNRYHFLHGMKNPDNPLEWAILDGNTTSTDNAPRGIGLTIIRDFFRFNNGNFCIVSGSHTFEILNTKERFKTLDYPFPGTIVTVGFNLRDTTSYYLASEQDITIQF